MDLELHCGARENTLIQTPSGRGSNKNQIALLKMLSSGIFTFQGWHLSASLSDLFQCILYVVFWLGQEFPTQARYPPALLYLVIFLLMLWASIYFNELSFDWAAVLCSFVLQHPISACLPGAQRSHALLYCCPMSFSICLPHFP